MAFSDIWPKIESKCRSAFGYAELLSKSISVAADKLVSILARIMSMAIKFATAFENDLAQ